VTGRKRLLIGIGVVAVATGVALSVVPDARTQQQVAPLAEAVTDLVRSLPPADGPLDPARTDSMLARAAAMRPLSSLLVWHRGELVVEEYYRGMRPDRAVNLKSVSKTLLSPLVGIALRDSLFANIEQPLRELLPEYYARLDGSPADDPRKDDIRLSHLLDMSSGLQTTSFGNYGAWVASPDWGWDQLRRPIQCRPGRCFEYTTGGTHLIGIAIARAAGKNLRQYARESLFGPMGIDLPGWDRDPQGNYLGGNNMALRPRDLLSIGVLYLQGGMYEGRQLVPRQWILDSWEARFRSPWNGHRYGSLWWRERWGGETAHFAWGYGGQYLVIVPRLDLVIVTTSALERRERGHTRQMRQFFNRYAVPAFRPRSN
jgi:CubicO group peptidase (beta-lactamase class C family)